MTGSDLTDTDLENADLSASILMGVKFIRVKLKNTNLQNANLTGAEDITMGQLKAAKRKFVSKHPYYKSREFKHKAVVS